MENVRFISMQKPTWAVLGQHVIDGCQEHSAAVFGVAAQVGLIGSAEIAAFCGVGFKFEAGDDVVFGHCKCFVERSYPSSTHKKINRHSLSAKL